MWINNPKSGRLAVPSSTVEKPNQYSTPGGGSGSVGVGIGKITSL